MAGFDFETVWAERRTFVVGRARIPVARLSHIIESKRRAGREKDRLFLAAHEEAIRDLIRSDRRGEASGLTVASSARSRTASPRSRRGPSRKG
ncbi:MAG: hypothetical protein ACREQQ_00440, partial [Candidatus Binatia bacterium]